MKKDINDLLLRMQTGENCIGETANKLLDLFALCGIFIPEAEIKQAARDDYDKQTKYDNAYDRQKGFIEGVKWAVSWLKNYRQLPTKHTTMTQEKANKIFATELGQQLNVIYVTSDNQPFIRYEEALLHTRELLKADTKNFVDTTITEWYPKI